jgi:hypothetical protein
MNEYGFPEAPKDYVWMSGQRFCVKTIVKSLLRQHATNDPFWGGIAAFDARHIPAPLGVGNA